MSNPRCRDTRNQEPRPAPGREPRSVAAVLLGAGRAPRARRVAAHAPGAGHPPARRPARASASTESRVPSTSGPDATRRHIPGMRGRPSSDRGARWRSEPRGCAVRPLPRDRLGGPQTGPPRRTRRCRPFRGLEARSTWLRSVIRGRARTRDGAAVDGGGVRPARGRCAPPSGGRYSPGAQRGPSAWPTAPSTHSRRAGAGRGGGGRGGPRRGAPARGQRRP
jgi:hypothetical protein